MLFFLYPVPNQMPNLLKTVLIIPNNIIFFQGEKTLETIDNYLYQYYQSSTNSDDYFTHIQSLTQIIPDSSIHQHLLTYTLQDQENTLYVEIEILYPGSQLYQIKTWKITPSNEWDMDQSMDIL